jgi:hypothetical protein
VKKTIQPQMILIGQTVSRRPLTSEALARSQGGICGGLRGTGTGFRRVLQFSPVNLIPSVIQRSIILADDSFVK